MRLLLALGWLVATAGALGAQAAGGGERTIDGQIAVGGGGEPRPVAGVWVVLHRVGPDSAGALDSTRTGADGRYRFRYRPTGSDEALYFVSASYGGIAYFTPPLRGGRVVDDDALLTVFDTTSAPVGLRLAGRHIVVAAPAPSGRRRVVEVFEIVNDSSLTAVGTAERPVWRTTIPEGATQFQVDPAGEIAPGAAAQRGDTVSLFAPVSPGVRQFSFSYELPPGAFPLDIHTDGPIELLEVLLQEPTARVAAPGLSEVDPVSSDGTQLRRFLAQDVPPGVELVIDVPRVGGISRSTMIAIVIGSAVAVMAAALAVALRRRRMRGAVPVSIAASPALSPTDSLIAELAAIDDRMAAAPLTAAEREAELERRTEVKRRLAELL